MADRSAFQDMQVSYLNLISECYSLTYDAMTAHVAIVFIRYLIIVMERRSNEDERTSGERSSLLRMNSGVSPFENPFRYGVVLIIIAMLTIFRRQLVLFYSD